jgi:lysophospholipase L1-like esterase
MLPISAILFSAILFHSVFAQVQIIGRVPSSPRLFTWPLTSIKFAFTGTQANFTYTASGQNAFAISINGSDITNATKTVVSVTSGTYGTGILSSGLHTVQIFRTSETDHGTVTFGGVQTDGLLVAVNPAARRIEIIGDSITAGFGVDGVAPCADSATTENAAKTYGAIIGRNFSADVSLIAWSGKGVLRNSPNSSGQSVGPIMPTLWLQTSALDTTPTYTFPPSAAPQAVIVNLGTNDFANGNRANLTQAEYQTAMLNFVKQIQSKYPNAKTFLVSSPMLSGAQHATQLAGLQGVGSSLKNVFVVDLPVQSAPFGCDSHPSPATHRQMASILIPVMKAQLGW